MKSLRMAKIHFEAGEYLQPLFSRQHPSGISIQDCSVPRYQERFSKYELAHFDKCRQSRDRNRDFISDVAWVRPEFMHAAGDELPLDTAQRTGLTLPEPGWAGRRVNRCVLCR